MNSSNSDPKFIGKAKLTRAGQLTLPKEARDDLKIGDSSQLYWYEINDVLVLIKDLINPRDLNTQINKKRRK